MVKIIRCASTNETKADFTNYFNEQITIKKGSRIALESMSVEIADKSRIEIPSNFTFKIQNTVENPEKSVTIPAGATYSKDSLASILKIKLNQTGNWRTDPNKINTEYKPFYDTNNKLNIQWLTNIEDSGRNLLTKSLYLSPYFTVTQGQDPLDDVIRQAPTGDSANFMITTQEMTSLNTGGIRCRLLGDTTAAYETSGFMLALVNQAYIKDKKKDNFNIQNPNVICGIRIDDEGIVELWQKGVQKTTAEFARVQIGAGGDNYTDFYIYKEQNVLKVYFSRQDDYGVFKQLVGTQDLINADGNIYFGVVAFPEFGAISQFSYLPSPYINSNATGISIIDYNSQKQDMENFVVFDDVGAPAQIPTTHTLTMPDLVKKIFGFHNNVYVLDATLGVFIAEDASVGAIYSDNILVEIPSLALECYDSTRNGRRNIIKFIPNDKLNTTHRKEYFSQFPVYINIRNMEDTYLNSIQLRFLDIDNNPLNTTGNEASCQAILIIEE